MPISSNGDTFTAIQKHDPMTILKINKEGKFTKTETEINFNLSQFRGSGGPIKYNEGYLGIIHEVYFVGPKGLRRYYHRFVWYSKDFKVTKITIPFYFFNNGIEYVCGMEMSISGKSILLGLGVLDKEAHICEIDLELVERYAYFDVVSGKLVA
jgi:hypothetical protein